MPVGHRPTPLTGRSRLLELARHLADAIVQAADEVIAGKLLAELGEDAAQLRPIADRMQVSISTVRSHLKQIHSKAGVETAVQLTQLVRGFCSC